MMRREATEIERLRQALRNIAEGNLGDAPWQANYARIKEVAAAALEAPLLVRSIKVRIKRTLQSPSGFVYLPVDEKISYDAP